MKLSVNRAVLADAVAWAARALPQRPNVPVLAGILIEAADDLTLSVFDYDVSARCAVPADVAEPGRVLLPGRVLAEIVKALPNKPVELALSGAEVILPCGASEFTLLTLPAGDYPALPQPPETVGTVDAAVLRDAVAQVVPATSKDDTLPMLTGIRLDTVGDILTLAATDRYRIAARTLPWERTTSDAEHAAVIPGRILHEIARGLGNGPASLLLGPGIAGVTCDGRTTTVRLLDDQFIDYNSRLDVDMPTWATVDVPPLLEAVKRVSLVADKGTAVRLGFTDGALVIQAGGADTGRGREQIPAGFDGADVEIAFQPGYLVDALAAIGTEQVKVGISGAAKPTLFVDDGDAPAFRCLLMALRVA